MGRQLDLFPMAPTSREQARDKRILMAVLRRAALPPLVGSTGLTRRQLRILMRPLPRITVPR
jgi:hypothetical protein